ncbi:MAG: transporter substrate-binding protein [Blastococcus sp.]|nr:transporter substrate-binding protein [Blastococcus sp.]
MLRNRLLSSVAAVAMVTALAACGSDDKKSGDAAGAPTMPASESDISGDIDKSKVQKDLVVGVDNPYYLFHEDILVAEEEGYFDEVGIDNVEIKTIEDPLPALIGGSLDLALYDTDTAIAAAAKGAGDITYLSTYLGGEANILGVGPGIATADDLKGKTITGGQFGSRNDFLIRKLLTDNGLDPEKDVELVSTGGQSNERLQAVISGTVDGASLQLRHRALLEAAGGKFLFEEVGQVPQNGWSVGPLLKESPETVTAFLTATLKARQYITDMANKDAVLKLAESKDFELPDEYKAAYEDENDPDYHTSDGGFEVSDMDDFVKTQTELEVIPPNTDWREFTNLVPLWRAQKALGLELRPAFSDFQ